MYSTILLHAVESKRLTSRDRVIFLDQLGSVSVTSMECKSTLSQDTSAGVHDYLLDGAARRRRVHHPAMSGPWPVLWNIFCLHVQVGQQSLKEEYNQP